jgi:tetratricopeptide (TPR) repeat protein
VRLARWARREPLKALLGVVLVVGLPLTGFLWERLRSKAGEVLAQEVRFRETLLEQAFLQLALGDHRTAERTLREVLREFPDASEALSGLALALLAQDRPAEALEALASKHGSLERVRVDVLRELGQEKPATELEAKLSPPATSLERYVEAARLLQRTAPVAGADTQVQLRERARTAVGLLAQARREAPDRALYAFALARAAGIAGDAENARLVAAEIERRWPEEAIAWYFVGLARRALDEEQAIAAFQRAAALDPELEAALQRQAEIAVERGEAGRALAELSSLAERDPRDAAHHANLALALLSERRLTEAEAAARRALELDPALVAAWDTLGNTLHDLGRLAEARDAFLSALALEPTGARLHNDLGIVLERLGEHEAAARALDEALRLDPLLALAHFNRAYVHWKRGEPALALEHLARAFECDRERQDPDLRRTQACEDAAVASQRLIAAGRAAEAPPRLERIVAAAPQCSRAHQVLVEALARLDRPDDALAAARRWSESCPDSADAWNQRAWLQVDPSADPERRDPRDALRAAEEAVRLSGGTEPAFRDTLAWALRWSGEQERAVEEAARALDLALEQGASEALVLELERSMQALEASAKATSSPR